MDVKQIIKEEFESILYEAPEKDFKNIIKTAKSRFKNILGIYPFRGAYGIKIYLLKKVSSDETLHPEENKVVTYLYSPITKVWSLVQKGKDKKEAHKYIKMNTGNRKLGIPINETSVMGGEGGFGHRTTWMSSEGNANWKEDRLRDLFPDHTIYDIPMEGNTLIESEIFESIKKGNVVTIIENDQKEKGHAIELIRSGWKLDNYLVATPMNIVHVEKSLTEIVLNEKKMTYLGQCDRLRMKNDCNEENWQLMMKNKKQIPINTFFSLVDFSPILDDGETVQDWISTYKEDMKTYKSVWGKNPCVFIQASGFEFIFR